MLCVEYKPTASDTHYVVRWVMWILGILIAWGAADLFMHHGLDDPQTRRSLIVVGIYWLVWFLRYVSISIRHTGD